MRSAVLAALCLGAIAVAISVIGVSPGTEKASATRPEESKRDVLLVANAFDGTVDLIDQRSLRRVEQIDARRSNSLRLTTEPR